MNVQRFRALTTLLVGVALVALLAAGVVAVRRPSHEPPRDDLNLAVVDTDATREVVDAVAEGLGRILVYDYRRPQRTQQAADAFLTGAARDQYQQIYGALQRAGTRQQLVHTSTVSQIGVQRLTGSSADLLVFLDQETVRTTDGAANRAPAQLRVEAVRKDGTWRVESIELL